LLYLQRLWWRRQSDETTRKHRSRPGGDALCGAGCGGDLDGTGSGGPATSIPCPGSRRAGQATRATASGLACRVLPASSWRSDFLQGIRAGRRAAVIVSGTRLCARRGFRERTVSSLQIHGGQDIPSRRNAALCIGPGFPMSLPRGASALLGGRQAASSHRTQRGGAQVELAAHCRRTPNRSLGVARRGPPRRALPLAAHHPRLPLPPAGPLEP